MTRTFVSVALIGAPSGTLAIFSSTSFILIFATWLLWSKSLKLSGPPALLAKNT